MIIAKLNIGTACWDIMVDNNTDVYHGKCYQHTFVGKMSELIKEYDITAVKLMGASVDYLAEYKDRIAERFPNIIVVCEERKPYEK